MNIAFLLFFKEDTPWAAVDSLFPRGSAGGAPGDLGVYGDLAAFACSFAVFTVFSFTFSLWCSFCVLRGI